MNRVNGALTLLLVSGAAAFAQDAPDTSDVLAEGTLQNCVAYALAHQPSIQQSILDEKITNRLIGSALSGWLPQVTLGVSAQHYYQIPVSIVGGSPVPVSLTNASTGTLAATQTIFSRDVLLAAATAGDLREESRQRTAGTTIDVVVNVSKAFYADLLTRQQISLLDDDILRLAQSFKDAFNQYQGGIVDKTDYMRATVSLNNAKAERRQNEELLKAREAFLKQQMGYPSGAALPVVYDTSRIEPDAMLDTTQAVDYGRRVEYQLLVVAKRLAEANLSYNDWSFIPTLSAFGAYSMNYQAGTIPPLFTHDYPASYVGLQLSLPVFLGGKRLFDISRASLEVRRAEYDLATFRYAADAEFAQAMADYKSNLNTYRVLTTNLALAQDVYNTVGLQYRAGTKTYLDVISAESDLRAAQVNRTNALYQLLSSKLDVERALGTIQY
ncbi:MAG TPA: TolC family protein [Bacteroidota bacterium]|nr:TolC family protein [Bacteroidota bacterium]